MHTLDVALEDPGVILLLCVTGRPRCLGDDLLLVPCLDLGELTERVEGKDLREMKNNKNSKVKLDPAWMNEPVYLFSAYSMLRVEKSNKYLFLFKKNYIGA